MTARTPINMAEVVARATSAPSVHNTQPWRFVAAGDALAVRADRDRQLAALDPDGRLLHISCGAAVEFGRLAVRAAGRECTVSLLPDRSDPDLLALLRVGAEATATPEERALVAAMRVRHTDRGPYRPAAVPTDVLASIRTAVEALDGWLKVVDRPGERVAVAALLDAAEAAEAAEPRYVEELARWRGDAPAAEGVPEGAAAPAWPSEVVSDVPLRDFHGAPARRRPSDPPPTVERDTLLLVGTGHDGPHAWLCTGRAVAALTLRVAAAGLASQPLAPVTDLPAYRSRLRDELAVLGHPQFLLRVGCGSVPTHPGRRAVSEVLSTAPAGDRVIDLTAREQMPAGEQRRR